jgi:hypothetical protein
VALLTGEEFIKMHAEWPITSLALLSLAGVLAVLARTPRFHLAWYLAGEALGVAVSYFLFWFGVLNPQFLLLVPGTTQLVIVAVLPMDWRLHHPVRLIQIRIGQGITMLGSCLLIVPTLIQILSGGVQTNGQILAEVISVVEAIVITMVGVGTGSRFLRFLGYTLLGVASLLGIFLGIKEGRIAETFGAVALLLIGLATWLSLRRSRGPSQADDQQPVGASPMPGPKSLYGGSPSGES